MDVENTILRWLTHINMGAAIALMAWLASQIITPGGV